MSARIATGAAAAGCVVALAFSSGGYFPSEWGLITLVFLLLIIAKVVLVDRIELGRPMLVLIGGLVAFGSWQLLSALWSENVALSVIEAERTLLYLAAVTALALCLMPATIPAFLDGLAVGVTIVAIYALGTRLAPGSLGGAYDPSSGYQLAKPIGYWNALGLLTVFGVLLAAGVALQKSAVRSPIAAAAAVPLFTCLYYTFSRGALVALGVGLITIVSLAADRLRATVIVAAFVAVPLLAVALARRPGSMTAAGATLETAQREGSRLAWQLTALAVLAAVIDVVLRRLDARWSIGQPLRRAASVAAVALIAGILVGALVHAGGPGAVVDRARAAFSEEQPATAAGLDRRLLSVSGNGRSGYWRVAAGMLERQPLLGTGAGSFTREWSKERPIANEARDAHNVYLETAAELGPLGLAAVLVVLAAPLAALCRARRHSSVPPAGAVLVAFLVHAGVDWDWEIPLLALFALSCGASILVLDPRRRAFALSTARRGALLAVIGVAFVMAFAMHVGNRAVASALDALAADDPASAAAHAERARRWVPWSSDGDQLLGEALIEAGDDDAARGALRRAALRNPGEWSIWYDLAIVSRGPERVNALTRARELNPLSVELLALGAENRSGSS